MVKISITNRTRGQQQKLDRQFLFEKKVRTDSSKNFRWTTTTRNRETRRRSTKRPSAGARTSGASVRRRRSWPRRRRRRRRCSRAGTTSWSGIRSDGRTSWRARTCRWVRVTPGTFWGSRTATTRRRTTPAPSSARIQTPTRISPFVSQTRFLWTRSYKTILA